jgi:hypothetical protein
MAAPSTRSTPPSNRLGCKGSAGVHFAPASSLRATS